MLDWVGDPYQIGILAGIVDAASKAGANLLCFVGGSLPTHPASSARHRIFDLATPNTVDGLVVLSATLMHDVGRSGVESYCKARLSGVPHCSIGVALDGVPSVVCNGERGISDVVAHLVKEHRHQRFAFVRGPLANVEAEERFRAYVRALEKHGLAFDPRLLATGNFLQASGYEAVRRFAQIPGMSLTDLDAIIASNDIMAIGVIQALDERGIAVPGSVAVTGFDDVDDARLAVSPLTTVRQPLDKIGRQAARNMLQFLQVGTSPESIEIDTELVVRRSCGCSRSWNTSLHSVAPELNHSFEAALVVRRQHILDALTRAARGGLGVAGADWQPRLLNAFVSELRDETPGAFARMMDDFAQLLVARGGDVQIFHDVIHVLRKQVSRTLRSDPVRRDRAEEIFYTTHLALSEAQQRGMSRETLRLGRWGRDISEVCNSLAHAFDASELRQQILEQLPRVGLESFFVVVYCEQRGLACARLLAARNEGRDLSPSHECSFDATTLLPSKTMQSIRDGRAFAVIPLTCKTLSLGHVVVELNLANLFCYDVIAAAIASGVYGARLAAKCCAVAQPSTQPTEQPAV